MTSDPLRILVVEDDYFAAQTLAREIIANGDTVVGPFANIHDALERVGLVQVAILDVRIQDETSFQVADSLIRHDIPFVFLTGYDPKVVPVRFERHHIYGKPSHAAPLLHDLHDQHRASVSQDGDSIEMLVIEMIRRSKSIMPDEPSAERLVEAVLLRAIAEVVDRRMDGDDIRTRLFDLLDDEYHQRGRLHLH